MKSLLVQLRLHLEAALVAAFGEAGRGVDPQVRASTDAKFGDYQSNVAMGLAKRLSRKPRDVAQQIVDALVGSAVRTDAEAPGVVGSAVRTIAGAPDQPARSASEGVSPRAPLPDAPKADVSDQDAAFNDLCEPPEIAGPGFINLRLRPAYLEEALRAIPPAPEATEAADTPSLALRTGTQPPTASVATDRAMTTPLPTDPRFDRLGIERVAEAERDTVVVDYSSPNVAKQMHVGHLRSTIIGDTIARVLEFEGHEVIPQNHIGDWGTQFGIILEEFRGRGLLQATSHPVSPTVSVLEFSKGHEWPRDPSELEAIYKAGNAKMANPDFADRAREAVTRLQSGDVAEIGVWESVAHASMAGITGVYQRLGVMLNERDTCGESFYNPFLPGIVAELRTALPEGENDPNRDREGAVQTDAARESRPLPHGRGSDQDLLVTWEVNQGALCVFFMKPNGSAAFRGPEGDRLPMLIQKSDGAYLYATTDLAAIAYRINTVTKGRAGISFHTGTALPQAFVGFGRHDGYLMHPPHPRSHGGFGATCILYVVGTPQKLHFEMLFAVARALGWTRPGDGSREVKLEHVVFGSVLGEDRKMLRTRSGESVKLKELLDEAVGKAREMIIKGERVEAGDIDRTAAVVGISAVKYADLCQNRNTDYVFSWDKMLALSGNTAPYMLYAYARIRSIYRKGEEAVSSQPSAFSQKPSAISFQPSAGGPAQSTIDKEFTRRGGQSAITLVQPAERALAMMILRLPEIIDAVADTLLPNILCDYLYDLAGKFMTFYESCPVLQAEDDVRTSRLRLCDLSARALKLGLSLLGIPTLERM